MKFALMLINIGLAVFALVLIVIGELFHRNTDFLEELRSDAHVGTLAIAAGSCLLLTTWFGSIISIIHHKWFFIIYGTLMLIIHIFQVVMGILAFLETLKQNYFIQGLLVEKFRIYYNDTVQNKTIEDDVNFMQKQWSCCGVRTITDYEKVLPDSCCPNKKTNADCTKDIASKNDCKTAAITTVQRPLGTVGIFAVLFAVFEFFLAMWSFYAAKKTSTR